MKNSRIISITDENFDELTFESRMPVMVFFGSKQCAVCKELFPIIQEIATDYATKINLYWVDVNKYKPLFQRLRLRGIPHLVFFNNGEVREKMSGLHPKEVIAGVIAKVISSDPIEDRSYEDTNSHMECLGCLTS